MTPALLALLFGACIVIGIAGSGLRVCDHFKIRGSRLERLVWILALGLGAAAYLVLLIGSAGWLHKEIFLVLMAGSLAVGSRRLIVEFREVFQIARAAWESAGWIQKLLAAPVLICLVLSLCAALAPAIGQDELCYHLTQPQNYVRAGRIYAVPYSANALWPYLTHMLFTLGLLVQGAESAKIFHWIFYVLTAAAVGSFVRRFVNGRAGWIATVCYLVTPAAFTQAGYAYIDHALALYVFLAFYAACVWTQTRSKGWAWLMGIACGLAASVKLIGLFAIFPAAVIVVASVRPGSIRSLAAAGLRMAAGAALAGSAWYIRSWLITGNPVYPFYPSFFGGHGFEDPTYVGVHGRGPGIGAFLLLPWDMTLHPDWFGGEVMGPLFLACAPLALLWARRNLAVRWAAAALAVYAVLWFKVDPNIRFFFAAFAWSSVLCGVAADAWMRDGSVPARRALTGIFLAIIVLQTGFAPHHFWDEARLITGADRSAYLKMNERSYDAAVEVNRMLGPDAWILSAGEVRGFYYEQRFTLAGDFERMTTVEQRPDSAADYAKYLRSIGFTHVLLSDAGSSRGSGTETERIVRDRETSRPYFKDELVVRSRGHQYVIYRIL